ncbi:hypothetical protein SODALDRAFT_400415 [Sodiomyces alkalinus F11]|uniref:LrgB-like protein n=1 Tax=Sodiomyces alkalinus (strain CBS 110278 / VKM F-3762 / F11) TaxID=1314773 RepID=A0A3N2PUH6_SODAK|nr:hypothetical protein SODALDRAFT_400415 [Sodiomyces alkalinus F11]ROT38142.1 hypothetical protein SODALDRAFT_400415 [Sodiomyces alkalinus F11]
MGAVTYPNGCLRQLGARMACAPYLHGVAGVVNELFWVVIIYLFSELLIWSLSLALRLAALEYFSAIFSMVVVFLFMTLLHQVCKTSDEFYHLRVKSKVDFINRNIGIGFPVPLVAISPDEALGGREIGAVIGNFVLTNIIFWPLIFILGWGVLTGVSCLPRYFSNNKGTPSQRPDKSTCMPTPPSQLELAPPLMRRSSDVSTLRNSATLTEREGTLVPEARAASIYLAKVENISPTSESQLSPQEAPKQGETERQQQNERDNEKPSSWSIPASFKTYYPIALSLFLLITVAIPVSHRTGDDRVLDGCVMWLTWITSTRLQRILTTRSQSRPSTTPLASNLKLTFTTLLNPVLLTTLAMTAYTRAKSAATSTPLPTVLATFTSGTSLSELWSHQASIYPLKPTKTPHFGAGDAALSLLESGIVVWGFKLQECRAQLASRAGVVVVLISTAAAALNAFAAPLLGHFALGLGAAPSLAFAARCTTLALARPAMEALDGNQVVNAALVVSNGIVGQLLYPFVLGRLGVVDTPGCHGKEKEKERQDGTGMEEVGDDDNDRDDAMIIAAGTTIGVNGAAMGVSYLYERKSRAAPYAALSMTVFGVMTVVFTAVEPFRGTLKALMR